MNNNSTHHRHLIFYIDKMNTIRHKRFDLELLQQTAYRYRLADSVQNLSHQKNISVFSWWISFRTIPMILLCTGLALIPADYAKAAGTNFFSATQVDVIPMGSNRLVRAVNDNGDIAGTVRKEDHRGPSGIVWRKDGLTEVINNDKQARKKPAGILGEEEAKLRKGEDYSTASAINNNLQVVGSMNTTTGMQAYRTDAQGNPVLLELPLGDTGSAALAINLAGKTTGWSSGPDGIRAVIWSPAGEAQILPRLPGSKSCRGQAINNSGDIAGVCDTVSGLRAVLWGGGSDKTAFDLGTLPGDSWSEASGINNRGDIVGASGLTGGDHHAVIWPKGGAIEELGTLTGHTSSKALAINNTGEVVGISEYNSNGHISDERAFMWTEQRGMEDLNDLVLSSSDFVLSHAIAISPRGLITAVGRHLDPDAEGHAHGTHELPLQVFRLSPQQLGRAK